MSRTLVLSSWVRRVAPSLGLFFFFLLAAIVQTWPLVLHMSHRMIDTPWAGADAWTMLWDLWWIKYSIVELQTNPFHTDYIFFPQGADLYLHVLIPVNGVLSIPLQLASGNVVFSWNVLSLLSLVASGLGMYALAYRITGNRIASLVSGYAFAFAPITMMHLQGGQWALSTTWPMPLFALFLIKAQETGSLRNAIGAGICWSLLTYNWLEFGIDGGLFLGLFLLYWSVPGIWRRDRAGLARLWRAGVITGVSWLLITAPLIIGAFDDVYAEGVPRVNGLEEFWSYDLLGFVSPSPLWGPGTLPNGAGWQHLDIGSILGTAYLGITPLLLGALALLLFRRTGHQAVFWTLVLFLFAIISLGPYLYVDGSKTHSVLGVSLTVPLPDKLLDDMPVMGERRIASRIFVFGLLGLSALAALGCHALMSWLRSTRWERFAPAAGLVILSLIALEYWSPPVHLSTMRSPAVIEAISDEPGDFSIIDIPLGRVTGTNSTGHGGGGIANYWQTLHEKRSFGGFLARASILDMVWLSEKQPVLRFLACSECLTPQTPEERNSEIVRGVFQEYRIKYVAVHRTTPNYYQTAVYDDQVRRWDKYLRHIAGLEQVYRDPDLTVYKNPRID